MKFMAPASLCGLKGGAKTIKINATFFFTVWHQAQTVEMIIISIEPTANNVKFMVPGIGVLLLGQGSGEDIIYMMVSLI